MLVTDEDSLETFASNISSAIVAVAVLIVLIVLFCCLKCTRNTNEFSELTHIKREQNIDAIKRLETLYKDEVLTTVQIYFELKIIHAEESTWFLFLEERLHELFHDYKQSKQRTPCCKNNRSSSCNFRQPYGQLSDKQFHLLYKRDPSILPVHEVEERGRILQHCICPLSPNTDSSVANLDITLICILMKTCRRTPAGDPRWFENIKTVRNKIYHRGDNSTIPDDQVEEWRKTLEDNVIKIAGTISPIYAKGVERRISELNEKYSQIDEIKDIITDHLANIQKSISQSLQNKNIQAGDLSFHITSAEIRDKPTTNLSTRASGSDKESRKCIVEWNFQTAGDWNVKQMEEKLQLFKNLGDFEIDFVYTGSFVVHTKVNMSIFFKDETFTDSIEEFLYLFVELLKIRGKPEDSLFLALVIVIPRTDDTNQEVPRPTELELIDSIEIQGGFTDCTVVGETFVVPDCDNNRLVLVDRDGEIKCYETTGEPWMVTAFGETIVVGVGRRDGNVQLIDYGTSNMIKQFHVEELMLGGLTYYRDNLYVGVSGNSIHVMDLRGHVIEYLRTEIDAYYMTIRNNRIYYTNGEELVCCRINGSYLWTFKSAMVRRIGGVTVDESGYIYLTGQDSQNVVVITPDGKNVKQLLSSADRLERPSGICYNSTTKTLLVCNDRGRVFLKK